MENTTKITLEVEVAAQRFIQQYMVNNDHIQKEIKAGIEAAFKKIDFKKVIESQVDKCIRRIISDSASWGRIRRVMDEKLSDIIDCKINEFVKGVNILIK